MCTFRVTNMKKSCLLCHIRAAFYSALRYFCYLGGHPKLQNHYVYACSQGQCTNSARSNIWVGLCSNTELAWTESRPVRGVLTPHTMATDYSNMLHISDLATSFKKAEGPAFLKFLSLVESTVTFLILPLSCLYGHNIYQNGGNIWSYWLCYCINDLKHVLRKVQRFPDKVLRFCSWLHIQQHTHNFENGWKCALSRVL